MYTRAFEIIPAAMRLFITFGITFFTVSFWPQKSVGQIRVTDQRCEKEHQRTLKMRESIIKTYTRGSRAVSQATAERMATNIEIAVDALCASAVERKLSTSQLRRESDRVILAAAGYSMHNEQFDLRDSTIAANFFRTGKYIVEPSTP
jgi:hypothetical protein